MIRGPNASRGIATVGVVSAIEDVLAAFTARGWTVTKKERVSGGRSPNPTRVDVTISSKQRLLLVLYAWRITGEGKGRTGKNYRIQTTRSHDGELLSERGRLTLGFGVDRERDVLAVFDGWTKRNTGNSSSVHITRALLDEAAANSFSTDGPRWDARAACRITAVDLLLPWIRRQNIPREAAVQVLGHEVTGETATASADLWDSAPAAWLRVGDRLALANRAGDQLVDNSLWTVTSLAVTVTQDGRYPRRSITFDLRRYGRVNNPARVLEGLARRPSR